MTRLVIDTSDSKKVKVGLRIEKKTYYLSSKTQALRAQAVLPLIDKILKQYKFTLDNIDFIQVNTGPGSFTGLRVGVAIANTLSFALLKPVNNKKLGEIEEPLY